ncbi:SDR family NAD(P)-dependent oxidoreductase [Thiofilum flexile]|uniref:SDR family NAD(P)-dependent oxidoreductase n=1 Tax=Thiofilum flexile TaxID=125627 RepID=UPI00037D3AC8|nr:SDR family NAD(P)-dependent oxidoreductase [Thiofilum flexile]
MQKTILITGATDGIGFETARILIEQGHHVLLHGRNSDKLAQVQANLHALSGAGSITAYVADLSDLNAVLTLAEHIHAEHTHLDVLINNAGVFKVAEALTPSGLDVRFVVNTLAPYLLTQELLPLLGGDARVVTLSSAAQSPVNLQALTGRVKLTDDFAAYAQSKLALTQWSRLLGLAQQGHGPLVVAVNPGSLLGTRMVREGFGMAGNDVRIGADILVQAALSEAFSQANGLYFDNDAGRFASGHADVQDDRKAQAVVEAIETVLSTVREQKG